MTASRTIKTVLLDTIGDLELREQDGGNALFVRIAGTETSVGSAWGPAADGTGEWFAWRSGSGARRVESRDAAGQYITTPTEEAPQ